MGFMNVLILRARWELEIKVKKVHALDREASVKTPARGCCGHLSTGQQPGDWHRQT